ncbi:alpha/beta fold hydrolase [Seongchinamella sediminis]|uniref:Alpha/beta fold hydrolase n=1 Tax=Seongchinamella sediminis TaxID=2283635 RepID=A0A3L7DVL5_9GAMM|nr:alpha/beta hydrolase [Seongchinamella sediminis]RLQ21608.1 alpha/beta fold hydrolase [Seongchinamella sediminis]
MKLQRGAGEYLACQHLEGHGPGILFLSGFNSNMQGDKAMALDAWCRSTGRQYTRFDYQGHGDSSGRFEDGTIGRWIDDALAVLDEVTRGPQLLVGSSMGGWLMLHLALARPARVVGLVGIAAAPDFTAALASGGLSAEQMLQLELSGYCAIDNCYDDGEPYHIGKGLLEEGRQHCLLERDAIAIDQPVRLLHGQCDDDVPWERSLLLAEKLTSSDVEIQLVKYGDHRLSRPHDLERLQRTISALLESLN